MTFALISILSMQVYVVSGCIMVELFFGGMTVPVLTGFMLAQVPPKMRAVASSLSTFTYNVLGFLPAPSVYGFVYHAYGSGVNRWGMVAIQSTSALGLIALIPAVICQRVRDAKELNKIKAINEVNENFN